MMHWGAVEPLDALRRPLPWPERLLIVQPGGLGDTLVALPVLRRIPPRTQVNWIGRASHCNIVGMMGAHQLRASDDRAGLDIRSFDALISFADLPADWLGRADQTAAVPVRIGSASGRLRPRWFNHLVHRPRKGVVLDRWAPLGRAAVGVQAYHRCPHARRCDSQACRCMADIEAWRVAATLRSGSRRGLNLEPLAPYLFAATAAASLRRAIDGAALPGGPS